MTELDDDAQFEHLTPFAREVVKAHLDRSRGISLERVQRIWFGIENEPMQFSQETLSMMLMDVAKSCGEDEAFVVLAVVRALRGQDPDHALKLQRTRRGRYLSPTQSVERSRDHENWLYELAKLERQGIKTEAAVREIAAKAGLSRATVFAGIRSAEAQLSVFRKLAGSEFPHSLENPRPVKSGKS